MFVVLKAAAVQQHLKRVFILKLIQDQFTREAQEIKKLLKSELTESTNWTNVGIALNRTFLYCPDKSWNFQNAFSNAVKHTSSDISWSLRQKRRVKMHLHLLGKDIYLGQEGGTIYGSWQAFGQHGPNSYGRVWQRAMKLNVMKYVSVREFFYT